MRNKFLAALLIFGASTPLLAQENLKLIKDDQALRNAVANLGDGGITVDYQVVDENGEQKTSGQVQVKQDPLKPDEVVVVKKNPDGTVTEVRRDKKLLTPTQWGEGLAWWDIGFGMIAGSVGEQFLNAPSENGAVPAGQLFGRQTEYHSQAFGMWSISAVVRPRIASQRITLGFDLMPTGCDGGMAYPEKGNTSVHSGLKCNAVKSLYGEFAFLRKGTEGKIHEFALGVAKVSAKVDHTMPNGIDGPTGKGSSDLALQTKQETLAPKFSYRFWGNSWAHPQVDVTVGKGIYFMNFLVRFSPKRKVHEVSKSPYGN